MQMVGRSGKGKRRVGDMVLRLTACDTGLDFLSGAGEDSHISVSVSDPPYGLCLIFTPQPL